jgi:hypothetical protein
LDEEAIMSTPFGPQLIGETEKTLNALLRRYLEGSDLTEPQWVTLRLADAFDGSVNADDLATAIADRAHFADAANLVAALTSRGLLANGRLNTAGRDLIRAVQARIANDTAPIWDSLPDDDVAAATRLLNEIINRARAMLADEAKLDPEQGVRDRA